MYHAQKLDVRRSGASLVATLPKANPPLIWRFDLERNHSFTCALQGQDHEWELGVTSVKGEFYPVARFPMREDAEEAFEAISKVLAKEDSGWGMTLVRNVGLALLLFFAVMLAINLINRPSTPGYNLAHEEAPAAAPETPAAPAPAPTGIPLPADEALKPPQ